MKRLFALLLIPVLCLCAACKKNQPAPAGPGIPGAVQTVGSITVFVPEGWEAVPDDDTQIRLCKGDAFSKSYIKLQVYPDSAAVLPPQRGCENVQELAARSYGSLSWSGFSGNKTTGTGVGTVAYLVTQNEGHNFLATIWYDEGSTAISVEDAEVQAILRDLSATIVEEELPATDTNQDEGPTDETTSTTSQDGETGIDGETAESPNEINPEG